MTAHALPIGLVQVPRAPGWLHVAGAVHEGLTQQTPSTHAPLPQSPAAAQVAPSAPP
ncbi:MAG: hypothetical protein IPJ34_06980 [Myxococcales bacterium]|nr:hypothetical protein [Myxococcales bacterium]